jgi:hypothetical protein
MKIITIYKESLATLVAWLLLTTPWFVGAQASEGLKNPIKVDSIQELLVILLNLVIVILTPIVVLFIILSGFKYVTARGNPAKIQEATQALTYAVIGGVLIIGAVAIAEIIKNLVSAF